MTWCVWSQILTQSIDPSSCNPKFCWRRPMGYGKMWSICTLV